MFLKKKSKKQVKFLFYRLPYIFVQIGLLVFFIFFIILFLNLQVFNSRTLAFDDEKPINLTAPRGQIFATDKEGNLYALASNLVVFKVYFKNFKNYPPEEIEKIYEQIKNYFPELKPEKLLTKNLVFLGQVNNNQKAELEKLKLDIIWFEPVYSRFYPYKEITGKITGFVQEGKGVYGLEAYYDNFLKGVDGLLVGNRLLRAPEKGADIITSLDINVQKKVYELTKNFVEKLEAKEGIVIIMKPKTGEVLSLVEIPSYDPNKYNLYDYELYNINALKPYELGSVIKPFVFALGIEKGIITPQTIYEDKGQVIVDGKIIKNWDGKAYGKITLQEALNKSLNLGAIFVAEQSGLSNLLNFYEILGFDEKTNIDLWPENTGDLSTLRFPYGRKINFYTASFGQGISLTPLRLLTAFNIFANQGIMVKPFLVKEIRNLNNSQKLSSSIVSRPISFSTYEVMNRMLQDVVENGFGKKARMKNYLVGGKTGTAQIFDLIARRYSSKTIHSFVGYFPATDPQFIILIVLKEPHEKFQFSSQTSPVLFKEIAEYLSRYYDIYPDKF